MKTKLLLILTLAASLLTFTGCKNTNPNIGPAMLRLGVSTTAGYSLMNNPKALPGVKAGASVICSVVNGTNVSPAAIVSALDAYGANNPETVFILNTAVSAYTLIYNSLPDTNVIVAQPYALAVCDGLNDALLFVSPPSAVLSSPRFQSQWPQMKFK